MRKDMLGISLLLCLGSACTQVKNRAMNDISLENFALERPLENEKTAAQNDYRILDERVVALAKALGKNPESYRMLIRMDSDGARIYRQMGAYVVIYPDQEMIYIPDRV